ncbi:Ig-like domain repeat protein [Nocardioides astragali]|uniref:Ig-like domain repeat protein n=1 Tax=Nocardioides astragali TaxID=1776736 RepID=UPI00210BE038|nr:Ig-like domain repeat protein [Nocardioides astragali]
MAVSATAATAATSHAVIATVPMGSGMGSGMGIDTANQSLYVSKSGAGVVSVLDLATNTVETTIPVTNPGRIAVDSSAHRAYVVRGGGANSLAVIDTTSNTVVGSLGGLSNPIGVAVDPTTHTVYVTNYDSQVVSVFDTTVTPATRTNTNIVGSRPWAVDVDPTTHKAYAATLFGGTLAVITGTTHTNSVEGFAGPIQVTVDPIGQRAYVVNNNANGVSVVNTTTETNLGTFNAGSGPSDMAVDPAKSTGFVTNRNDDTVSVIDLTDNSVDGTVPVGDNPQSVEVDPMTGRAYVANADNTISVIALLTSQEITFTSTPPAQPVVGTTYAATATGGASGNPVTFSTSSSACTVTPAGMVTFSHVGQCVVSADQAGNDGYFPAPTVDQTMTVGAGPQAITFTSSPPSPASVGGSYTVETSGGGSAQPVTLSVHGTTTNDACSITGDLVSFDHVGRCVIAADQAGDADHTAAPTATQQIDVVHEATTTVVTLPTSEVVYGQLARATVLVGNTTEGSVQFTVDGAPVGAPVAPASDGTARSPELTGSKLAVGAHPVGAVFTPSDTNRYATSTATPATLTVDKAATTSAVSVTGTAITAAVAPVAPGAGDPTGSVRFYVAGTEVGTATLTRGTATLTYEVPAGSTREVSSVYAGNAAFTGSSASTARRDPAITATVSSNKARRNGWYSTPVTVSFACKESGSPLTNPCPAPVRLSRNAAGQTVTRTIIAADGGADTAVVKGINIDAVRPVVRVTGVRAGATYFANGPVAGCRATDRHSGVATCKVRRTTKGNRVVYVAVATDRAGNRSSTRVVARTAAVVIRGASMEHGHYVVHRGRTYTVLVEAATRPSYVYASHTPRPPAGGGIPFKRIDKFTWALGVTFTHSMRHHTWWNIGTRVGTRTTVTTVKVVR